MQELVFLLVIMVMTALGVRVFLGQLHGTPVRLPKLRLSLPSLPRRRKGRRNRRPDLRAEQPIEEYEEAGFAPAASPFIASAPAGRTNLMEAVRYEPQAFDEEDEYEEGEDDYLPASQVDFFAGEQARPAARFVAASSDSEAVAGYEAAPSQDGGPTVEGVQTADPVVAASPLHEVAAEPDPNDIMSFFEKAAAVTQLPETLREGLESVSGAELLAEARQLRALLHRDAA